MSSDMDASRQARRARLLAEAAPGARTVDFSWTGGSSNALVLGEGSPVLLVHGGMGTNLQWAPILGALAREHRVVAVDRPANGLASAFDYRGVDVEAHAADFLRQAMDALELPTATVVGNSMGGRWAMALAKHHPQRVERLVLVGAPAGSEGRALPGPIRGMRTPGARALIGRFAVRGGAAGARNFYASCLAAHPERQDDVFWDAMAADTERNFHNWLPFLANVLTLSGKVGPNLNLDGKLGEVKVPTHFVWGEKDAFAGPARGRDVARQIAGATFHVVPDAGHLPWIDAPTEVAEAILAAAAGRAS